MARSRWLTSALPSIVLVAALLVATSSGAPDAGPQPPSKVLAATGTVQVIGRTWRGYPLIAEHHGSATAPQLVVLIGVIHGNETYGAKVVKRLRELTMPTGVQLWIIPSMNKDGQFLRRRGNQHGVDLNRNFPVAWRHGGLGTPTYSGPKAASEPETRAVMAFLAKVKPDLVVILHSPLRGVDLYQAKRPDLVRYLSAQTGLPTKTFSCGSAGCHGTLTQWFNTTQKGTAITVEFGAGTPRPYLINRLSSAILTAR